MRVLIQQPNHCLHVPKDKQASLSLWELWEQLPGTPELRESVAIKDHNCGKVKHQKAYNKTWESFGSFKKWRISQSSRK